MMAIKKFTQTLAVAWAAVFFITTGFAKKMHLTQRSAFANTTTPATISATITPKPSFTMSTGSFNLAACPSTDGEGWYDCWRPEDPQDFGFDPRSPYNTTVHPYNIVPPDPSVASLCGSLWTSSASSYFSTAPISTNTEFGWVYFPNEFTWVPSEPCCLNCTLVGGAITVMVWPTPAPTPAVNTLVDTANNFTFTSPSIYVAFDSIGATDMCGSVGPSFTNMTIGFAPNALSTQRNFYAGSATGEQGALDGDYCTHATPNGLWQTFDYQDAAKGECTEITTSWWSYYASNDTTMYSDESDYAAATDISCGYGCLGQPTDQFTCVYNPCSPWVSVPTQLYDLNQKFHTCVDGIKAFFDPPYTLTQGNGLVAFSSVPASLSSAAPAQSPAPVLAAPTPTPTPNEPTPTPTSSPDPPPQSNNDPPPQSNNDPPPQSNNDPPPDSKQPAPSSPKPDPPENSPPSPIAVIGSVTVSFDPSSNIIVGSQTINAGDPAITTNGHTFSLAPSGSALVIDGSTSAIPKYTPPAAPAVEILTTIPNGATGLVLAGGQTITAGGSSTIIAGTTYSLAPGGDAIVINGVTSPVPTAGPHIVTSAGMSLLVVGSQTILPGSSAIIVSGTTYSLASSGNALIIDGTSQYLIGSQTLVAGGSAITVSGTVVSLLSGGQSVVVGGTTEAIASLLESAGGSGLGGAIMTIGGFSTSGAGGYNGTVFTGGVGRLSEARWIGRDVLGVGLVWVACLGVLWVL